MARKDRTLAGFGDVAGNNNQNVNDNVNNKNEATEPAEEHPDYLDKLLDAGKPKHDLTLVGVYLEPDVAKLLDQLGKKGGRGAKSRIANDALRKYFLDKGLM